MLVKQIYAILVALFVSATCVDASTRTGLDVFSSNKFAQLKGKKVALVVNQTSLSDSGAFSGDLLLDEAARTRRASPLRLVAIFTPEHGLNGARKAGATSDSAETYRGVPVYSLYGSTRKPTLKMLRGIDVLVFDMQDIGVRPYTFLSTMILAMEAAAENNIEFVVLDRPNPLGGERVEGNVLDTSLRSFVGQIPIPYIHGMTLGELAKMAVGEGWFKSAAKLKLTVVPMQGWSRRMTWPETKLKWVAPSPNIPTWRSAVGCAIFGAIGELGTLSVGIGTDAPFLRLGSHLVKGDALLSAAKATLPKELTLTRKDFTLPFGDSEKSYNGVAVVLPDDIARIGRLYGPALSLFATLLSDTAFAKAYSAVVFSSKRMFEKVTGTHDVLKCYNSDTAALAKVMASWKRDEAAFRTRRQKYLIYK
ncbi:MAG: DUF1343 domain-containing protein [Bacteroidetes bacterium]|nr:DUF1343 domain-containing protein [Bacteroidota bacterium]